MAYAHVNNQRLYFEDTGGNGPVIVFSHGLLMDHEMFAPQVAALRDRYRVITWDERGHGLTAGSTLEPFSYYDSANDLAALLQHLGIKRAILAGMSQGGYLSLRCALTHPEIVRALVLIDTQAMPEDPAKMPAYKQMLDAWAAHGLSAQISTIIEQIILGTGWAGSALWKEKWKHVQPHNLIGCFHTLGNRDDISSKLAQIKVPALVIHGEKDMAITLDRARALANGLPHAELAVIPGAGHAANLTHAAAVTPLIERFLTSLEKDA
ncbi:MAG: alpha/beta fold hydrolase [Stenotrophobium sp.]